MSARVKIKPEHWAQARKDFPKDEMMAEIHAIRIAMYEAEKAKAQAKGKPRTKKTKAA